MNQRAAAMEEVAALIDAESGEVTTHGAITALAGELEQAIGGRRLVFHFGEQSVRSIALYRASLQANCAVAMLDAGLDAQLMGSLVARYAPDVIVATTASARPSDAAYQEVLPDVFLRSGAPTKLHPDLAVLLSTSGSTGSPKFVRLSRTNIESNTAAIAKSLSLDSTDVAITTLPAFYSYGMSVINSHLAVGSPVVVTAASLFEPAFWDAVRAQRVTLLNGVPSTFEMLKRLRLERMDLPNLRGLTQAGGKLADSEVERFAGIMGERGGDFYVMYGQTEAAPRIACRSVNATAEHRGSVGRALDGGELRVVSPDGVALAAGESGEIVYTGPNVMMGYAEEAADLAAAGPAGQELRTGDLGYLDDAGYLYITGRSKRIAKITGLRVSLDEIEGMVDSNGMVAAIAETDGVVVFCDWGDDDRYKSISRELCRQMKLPPRSITLRRVDEFPVLSNGKIDYQQLQRTWAGKNDGT